MTGVEFEIDTNKVDNTNGTMMPRNFHTETFDFISRNGKNVKNLKQVGAYDLVTSLHGGEMRLWIITENREVYLYPKNTSKG